MRRAAYLRAKEQRATDPRYLAMKEASKLRRREAYQAAKGRAKATAAARKQVQKERADAERVAKRVAADEKLRSKVRFAGDAPSDAAHGSEYSSLARRRRGGT
jgi:hypothetical protein